MRLNVDECWERLAAAEHGVLATVHAERGVDAVPVVYAVADRTILFPVDTVKAKSTTDLQRLANLERDPRCVLLVDEYDRDWSKLWWVRVHGVAEPCEDDWSPLHRFAAYRVPGAIHAVVRIRPTAVMGWSAGPQQQD